MTASNPLGHFVLLVLVQGRFGGLEFSSITAIFGIFTISVLVANQKQAHFPSRGRHQLALPFMLVRHDLAAYHAAGLFVDYGDEEVGTHSSLWI